MGVVVGVGSDGGKESCSEGGVGVWRWDVVADS